MAQSIKQKRAYASAFKLAVIQDFKLTTLSVNEFAIARNISASTVRAWAKGAGVPLKKAKVVVTSTSIKDVPVVQKNGEITYKGKVFVSR